MELAWDSQNSMDPPIQRVLVRMRDLTLHLVYFKTQSQITEQQKIHQLRSLIFMSSIRPQHLAKFANQMPAVHHQAPTVASKPSNTVVSKIILKSIY